MKFNHFILICVLFLFIVSCNYQYDDFKEDPIITAINVVKAPNKTTYVINEKIDLTGLTIEALYSDDSKVIIEDYNVVYSDINLGVNTIIIQYNNLETSFDVFVIEPTIIGLNIINLPNKTIYFIDEKIDLTGLLVEGIYDDGSKITIDDYSCVYSELKLGYNEIIIKYNNLETSFKVYVNNYEKVSINDINDYSSSSIMNIRFIDYDLRFTDVKYGARREEDMMIVYDENMFVQTNIYGYEVSVDEFGLVVETGVNVSLVDNGFVVSGHGVSSKLLKDINVGDICIFIDENVYIYQSQHIDKRSKVYLKILDVKNEINLITDIKGYNVYVSELNGVIEQFNAITTEYDEKIDILYELLCDMSDSLTISLYDNVHDYNYVELDYSLMDKVYEDDNNYINFINYTEKLYYGGFRNQDTIVLYNEDNYRTRNPYGYEVAVDKNNIIIDKQILVDLPEEGYILSGHGTGAEFIKNNLTIGNKVEITSSSIKFYKDLGANEYNELISKRNDLVNLLNEHINNSIPHDYEYINKLMLYIDNVISYSDLVITNCYDVCNVSKCIKKVEEYFVVLYSQLIDHKVLETRGMWYYPFLYPAAYDDTTLDGVRNTLDKFKEMGFNEIVIIPFCGKYCLFESDYFYYYDELNDYSYGEYGNDYLACFISEAHKRGITVNAFTQTFRCYEEGSKVFDESHYQLQYDGTFSRGQIYYYDICSDYVQENLINWYKELVTLYDFDKVEYDIIRYSVSNLRSFNSIDVIPDNAIINDPGYTEYSMNKFMEMYNLEGDLKVLIKESLDIRIKWMEFKENELIKFITKATNEMKSIKPNLVISAAVFNEYDKAKSNYLQDSKKWLELGIVDIIEPMVYSDDYLFVVDKITYFNEEFAEFDVRIGLSYGLTVNELMMQIEAASDNGYILFHTGDYLQSSYYNILKNSFHFDYVSEISSSEDKKVAIINDLVDKITNYYEVKNNKSYKNLITYLKEYNYNLLIKELEKIEDKGMIHYISNIILQIETI